MRRDWDLVRKILIKLEEQSDPQGFLDADEVKGYGSGTVAYHMYLMNDGGLIEIIDTSDKRDMHCIATSLTWEGHEFLDKIRRDTAWNKIKGTLREKGIDLSVDAIKVGAKYILKSSFGLEHVD